MESDSKNWRAISQKVCKLNSSRAKTKQNLPSSLKQLLGNRRAIWKAISKNGGRFGRRFQKNGGRFGGRFQKTEGDLTGDFPKWRAIWRVIFRYRVSINQVFFENMAQGHYKTIVFESEGDSGATESLGEGQGRPGRPSGAQGRGGGGQERSAGQESHRTAQGCPVGRRRFRTAQRESRRAQGNAGPGRRK